MCIKRHYDCTRMHKFPVSPIIIIVIKRCMYFSFKEKGVLLLEAITEGNQGLALQLINDGADLKLESVCYHLFQTNS